MKFSVLREFNAVVKQVNSELGCEYLQLVLPTMFRDGAWACCIEGAGTLGDYAFNRLYRVIERENLLFFFSSMSGHVAIHIQ